jgi:Transposase, Mutator family
MARVTRASVALKCANSSAAISHTIGALAEYERADGREPLRPGQRPNVERVSLGELIHQCVRGAIETAVHEELRATLGVQPYERHKARRGLSQRDEDAYIHWPERPPGTHGAARHAVRRAGVDAGKVVSVPVLGVVGVLADGRKQLLALDLCSGESFAAWKGCLDVWFCSSASWRAVKSSCAGSMAGRRSPLC